MRYKYADFLIIIFYLGMIYVGVALVINPHPSMPGITDDAYTWVDEELRLHGTLLVVGSSLGILAKIKFKKYVEATARYVLAGSCLLRVFIDIFVYGIGYWNVYWLSAGILLLSTGLVLPEPSVKMLIERVKREI